MTTENELEQVKEYKVVTLSHKKNEPEVTVEMRKVDKT